MTQRRSLCTTNPQARLRKGPPIPGGVDFQNIVDKYVIEYDKLLVVIYSLFLILSLFNFIILSFAFLLKKFLFLTNIFYLVEITESLAKQKPLYFQWFG